MKKITIAAAFWLSASGASQAGGKLVNVVKTPGNGIQPQAVIDAKGTTHLLYFTGAPNAGNLMYARRGPGELRFSAPIKVNSQDGSAIAVGSIRGGQLALGMNGRVHVAWNGSGKAEPKNPIVGTPMLYARLADDGKSFEPQCNLMTQSAVLDGGGALTADAKGNVFVAWHALGKDLVKGEDNRKVWMSISNDEGKSFAPEKLAWSENTGACSCCGMRGFVDSKGDVHFLYRAAGKKIDRGMYSLFSADLGKTFRGEQLDNWKIDRCPLSSEAFAEGSSVVGAWENDGRIFFRAVGDPRDNVERKINEAPGKGGDRQHPALAFNKNGDMILVWTEGTGWNRGGALAWQVYDKDLRPTESGRRPGAIPVWGLPTVVAELDGRFTILH